MEKPAVELSEAMRAKWAQRLSIRVDREDTGQNLGLTVKALAHGDPVKRLKALSVALATERVIVPINVEQHPDVDGEHHHIDPHSDDAPQFRMEDTLAGPGIVVFTSAEALAAYDPHARPMPLDFRKVALTALRDGTPRVVLNPATDNIRMPRPLVAALAQGDTWLPAWEDRELLDELLSMAAERNIDGRIHGVRLRPYDGGFIVVLEIFGVLPDNTMESNQWLMEVQSYLSSSPRLRVAVDIVLQNPDMTYLREEKGALETGHPSGEEDTEEKEDASMVK